jgi:hypothetical protein
MNTKICIECLEDKPLTSFFSNGYYKGRKKYKPRCGRCEIAIKSTRLRTIIDKFYGKMECTLCGYSKCTSALECHHRKDTGKIMEVSKMGSFSESKIVAELEKCDLVCANCHVEIHTTTGMWV